MELKAEMFAENDIVGLHKLTESNNSNNNIKIIMFAWLNT
jgi:hypothetical protein